MDIVNWVYLKKAELIRQNLSDPTDLVLLGADVTFDKRGDKYLSYAMTTADFADAIAGIIGAGSGTVSSIDVNGGTGISVSPAGPITTFGTFTVTNTAPDQTVVLNNGAGISVTGIYPNFTISTSGGPGNTYTADNGITENPANNFQLGGDTYADSTFDNSRYIDTQLNAFYLKGQVVTTVGAGGVITGILNINNELGSGFATGLKIDVDQPGQAGGYGAYIKTNTATGIRIFCDDAKGLDVLSYGSGIGEAATIYSAERTGFSVRCDSNATTTPAARLVKGGDDQNSVQTILSLWKAVNFPDVGQPGIGGSIDFSLATDDDNVLNTAGRIAFIASNVVEGSMSSYYRLSVFNLGTEENVLIVNGEGLFELPLGLDNYANDAAAAVGGIPVNGLYRNGSVVQIRVI
jgi:hypothetical protein